MDVIPFAPRANVLVQGGPAGLVAWMVVTGDPNGSVRAAKGTRAFTVDGLNAWDNIDGAVAWTPIQIGGAGLYVPLTRTVNGKALSTDIALDAADVGADPAGAAVAAAGVVQGNLTTHAGQTGTAVHGLGSASTHAASDFIPSTTKLPVLLTNYGGDPTGTDDNVAAFVAAFAVSNYVIVPPGTYKILSAVEVGSDQGIIAMPGAKISVGADNIYAIRMLGDRGLVRGPLEIDFGGRVAQAGVIAYGSNNIIERVYVHNGISTASIGIALDGTSTTCSQNIVRECRVESVGGCAYSLYKTSRCFVLHNRAVGVGLIGISCWQAPTSVIEGNLIIACQQEALTLDGGSSYCRVVGNGFHDTCKNTGGGAAGAAVSIDNSIECTLTGNLIRTCTKPGIWTANVDGGASYNAFVGNQIVECAQYGIYFHAGIAPSVYNVVSGNLIVGGAFTHWIRFDAGCDNNECRYNQKTGLAVSDAGAGNAY